MCNCYGHPCKVCGLEISIHLGDFSTQPEEIEVFCRKHIPKEKNPNLRIWDINSPNEREEAGTTRMAIKALTDNARGLWNLNHPNLLSIKRRHDLETG